jgi:hypothetical protein
MLLFSKLPAMPCALTLTLATVSTKIASEDFKNEIVLL